MLLFETFKFIVRGSEVWNQANFSDTQLADGYSAYMRDARETQALLDEEEGEAKKVWTGILKRLGGRLRKIRMVSHLCNEIRHMEYFDTPTNIDQEIPNRLEPHPHDHYDTHRYGCRYPIAIAGDRLFVTVLSCLAASNITVPRITIKQNMTETVECANIPGWQHLDLRLDKLKFCPQIIHNTNSWAAAWMLSDLPCLRKEEVKMKASKIVHDLVDKCHTTLQRLALEGQGAIDWPTQPSTYELPALQYLVYTFESVNPYLFRDWIARMPMLRHLRLTGGLSTVIDFVEWRHILDAVRDHPNVDGLNPKGISLDLDKIIAGERAEVTEISCSEVICKDTNIATGRIPRNIATDRYAHITDLDDLLDSDLALERHLYGVPFEHNHQLRYQLGDWEEGLPDSDALRRRGRRRNMCSSDDKQGQESRAEGK